MRALSLRQPYASFIVRGIKRYELRKWQTPYRGTIAIHASSGTTPRVFEEADENDTLGALFCQQGWGHSRDLKPLARMAVVGAVDLIRIVDARRLWKTLSAEDRFLLTSAEEPEPGQYIWEFAQAVEISPVPVLGKLNLWELPTDVTRAVERGLQKPLKRESVKSSLIARAKKARSERIADNQALFNEPADYSEAVAAIVGPPPRSRTEVMTRVWQYIKAHRLQDPKDSSIILVQKLLRDVIPGQSRVTLFEMTEYLFEHFE